MKRHAVAIAVVLLAGGFAPAAMNPENVGGGPPEFNVELSRKVAADAQVRSLQAQVGALRATADSVQGDTEQSAASAQAADPGRQKPAASAAVSGRRLRDPPATTPPGR